LIGPFFVPRDIITPSRPD